MKGDSPAPGHKEEEGGARGSSLRASPVRGPGVPVPRGGDLRRKAQRSPQMKQEASSTEHPAGWRDPARETHVPVPRL